MAPAAQRTNFIHRELYDVVIAYVDWNLETKQDVLNWYQQYADYFRRRGSKRFDLILELSKFRFNPKIASYFSAYRTRVLAEFTHRSYRVRQTLETRTFMYTSHVLHGTPANDYGSIELALRALSEDRARDRARAPGTMGALPGITPA